MLRDIPLEPEQKDLLAMLVEAARNVPRDQRQEFILLRVVEGSILLHPGLAGSRTEGIYEGDVKALARAGLLALSYGSGGTISFDVSPLGFRYYEDMKRRLGEPIQKAEAMPRKYLNSDGFRKKYPDVYRKWAEAETLLWSSESEAQLTTIGHLCREALQGFAEAVAEQHRLPAIDPDRSHTVARLRAVIGLKKENLGSQEHPFLDALLVYWGTISDLVQRQEHGGQKEGRPLTWEDGRRIVFQTAVLMFEVDSSLSRAQS